MQFRQTWCTKQHFTLKLQYGRACQKGKTHSILNHWHLSLNCCHCCEPLALFCESLILLPCTADILPWNIGALREIPDILPCCQFTMTLESLILTLASESFAWHFRGKTKLKIYLESHCKYGTACYQENDWHFILILLYSTASCREEIKKTKKTIVWRPLLINCLSFFYFFLLLFLPALFISVCLWQWQSCQNCHVYGLRPGFFWSVHYQSCFFVFLFFGSIFCHSKTAGP